MQGSSGVGGAGEVGDIDGDELPLEVEEWLSWLSTERGRSGATLAAYRHEAWRWWRWLRSRGHELADADEALIEAFVGHLRGHRLHRGEGGDRRHDGDRGGRRHRGGGDGPDVRDAGVGERGLAPATVKKATVAVRSLYRFLAEEGLLPADPGADVATPQVPANLPKALTEGEISALLGAVVGDEPVARRDRAILEVLYGTGLRISELVGLSLGDLDLESALLRAFGKGSRERVVPVGRHALAALGDWLAPGGRPDLEPRQWARRGDAEAVFLNRRGGRLTRQGAWLVVKRHGDAVGLGPKLSPHVLRHSCATHMLDHGADIRAVQELLGHASIGTTQVYTKVSTERLFAAYRAAHPRAVA